MNNSPHEYGPHCSPADPMRSTVTPESRSASSSRVSPKSGLGLPSSQQILQPQQMGPYPVTSYPLNPSQPTSSVVPAQIRPQVPSYQPAASSTKVPPPNGASMFRIQMWANNYDSGVQSMNHSAAPSMLSMSSLRAGSQMSTVSEDTNTHVDLTDQQQMKFENIPANIGRGAQEGETRKAIPEVIHLLSDHDEVVVQRAATMVQNIAKMDSEQPQYAKPWINAPEVVPLLKKLLHTHVNSPGIIKAALGALFQISVRRDGLDSILRVNDETSGDLLVSIIQHIKFNGGSARYAILTFHSIIAEKSVMSRNIDCARAAGALQAVTQFLDREANEKLLSVLVECVKILCDKNESQREMFIQLKGPAKIFHVLRNFRYEGLLWRTVGLLKMLSNTDPRTVVTNGGYEFLPYLLSHASQRIVLSTLECIRNMSDVVTKEIDVSKLLDILLQLLGILSNLLANNQRNKEYVFNHGGIPALFRVLVNVYNIPAVTSNQQQRVEDIQERSLATLRHLCVGNCHHAEAQKAVFQGECAEFLLRKLTEMRPSILKQTLQILNKAVHQDANLPTFQSTCIQTSSGEEATFVKQIIVVLQAACRQLPLSSRIEDVSVAELIFLSLSTLQAMCKSRSLLDQVVYFIKAPGLLICGRDDAMILPVFCLRQRVEDENVKRSALGLISELACHPEMAAMYLADAVLMNELQSCVGSRNQAIATYAQQAYERTLLARNLPINYANQAPVIRPAAPGSSAQPVVGYGAQYPPQTQYPSAYGAPASYSQQGPYPHLQSTAAAPLQYMQPQHVPSQRHSEEEAVLPVNNNLPAAYGREGPSQQYVDLPANSMDYSEEPWPQDLSGLSITENDPFANMFCSQNLDTTLQRPQQSIRPLYSSGNRGHEALPSGNYCCPGPPVPSYGPAPMETMHVGSPEAPASWQDPVAYSDYPM